MIRAPAISARASATRWRWPPERLTPRSPISVSYPSGRSSANSVDAGRVARGEHVIPPHVRPAGVRFSRSGIEKRIGRCVTIATADAELGEREVARVDSADRARGRSVGS